MGGCGSYHTHEGDFYGDGFYKTGDNGYLNNESSFIGSNEKLSGKLDEEGEEVATLKDLATEVKASVSQHDGELVGENLGSIEKKYAELQNRSQHQTEAYEEFIVNYETVTQEMDAQLQWLKDTQKTVTAGGAVGFDAKDAEEKLREHAVLLREIEAGQAKLEQYSRQGEGFLKELSPAERDQIEKKLQELQILHQTVTDKAAEKQKALNQNVAERVGFQLELERILTWIQEKENLVSQEPKSCYKAADVEKNIKKLKLLLSEVNAYEPNIVNLEKESAKILDQCDEDSKQQLENNLKDVKTRYEAIKTKLQARINQEQDTLQNRKQFEENLLKIELWIKDAETLCAHELVLDCPVEQLHEDVKKHQNAVNNGQNIGQLQTSVGQNAEELLPHLTDAEQAALKEQLHSLKEGFNRVSSDLERRKGTLEEALSTKCKFEEELESCSQFITKCQNEMRRLNKPVGHKENDAKDMLEDSQKLQDRLSDYQPTMTLLIQTTDQLKAIGQPSASEEIAKLNVQYKELSDQAVQQKQKLNQAVQLREQYYGVKADVEMCLKECKEQMESVNVLGVTVPTKLDRFQTVLEKLKSKDPQISQIEDKAQQIGIQGTADDTKALQEQIADIKNRLKGLLTDADNGVKHFETILSERQIFEKELGENIEKLKQKEKQLKTHGTLNLENNSADPELEKLKGFQQEVDKQLQYVHEQIEEQKGKFDDLDEAIPLVLQEQVEEFNDLRDKLQVKIHDQEEFLTKAKENRVTFNATWQDLAEWVKAAEGQVQPKYDGVDLETATEQLELQKDDLATDIEYDTVDAQLASFKAVFANEPEIQGKMDNLLDVAEKMAPTLDINEKETLKGSLKNLHQKLANVTTLSKEREKMLEEGIEEWKDYKLKLAVVEETLSNVQERCSHLPTIAPISIDHAKGQMVETQEYLSTMEKQKTAIDELNKLAKVMERKAAPTSRQTIDSSLENINDRWNSLHKEADEKHKVIQETVDDWTAYTETAEKMKQILQEAETQMSPEEFEKVTASDLGEQLQTAQAVSSQVEECKGKLQTLQKSGQTVLAKLQTSEVKAAIQKEMMEIQDKCDQFKWKAAEHQKAIESEASERENFAKEITETISWLDQTQGTIDSLTPEGVEVAEVEDKMETQQGLKQDLNLKVAQAKKIIELQQEKYADQVSEMPQELLEKIETLQTMEEKVASLMENKEKELEEAKKARLEYHTNLQVLKTWIEDAEQQLEEKPEDLKQGNEKYQELATSFETVDPKFELLEDYARQIAKTASPEEREAVMATVAELNARKEQLHQKADSKADTLKEAAQLWANFEDMSGELNSWVDHAEDVTKTQLEWTSLDKVKGQLQDHRQLTGEATANAKRLEVLDETVEKLKQLGGAEEAIAKIEVTRERYLAAQEESTERLNTLEEAAEQWADYQNEVDVLSNWMEVSKSKLESQSTAMTLQEKLEAQEKMIKDIEKHQSKVDNVLAKHEELKAVAGDLSPADQVVKDIDTLKDTTIKERDRLKEAIKQQKEYDDEVGRLTQMINDAQEKLKGAPMAASTVEGLQGQLADHNALAAQIRTWQEQIDEINAKSQELTDEKFLKPMELSDLESIPDTGVQPTPSVSSVSSGTFNQQRKDSGIMMSPDGAAIQSALEETDAGRPRETGPPIADRYRPGSPMSIRSDDTDMLLAEDGRLVPASTRSQVSDTSTLVGSGSTALLMASQDPETASVGSMDSTSTYVTVDGKPVSVPYSVAKMMRLEPGQTLEYMELPQSVKLQTSEVPGSLSIAQARLGEVSQVEEVVDTMTGQVMNLGIPGQSTADIYDQPPQDLQMATASDVPFQIFEPGADTLEESITPLRAYKTPEGRIVLTRMPLENMEGMTLETISQIEPTHKQTAAPGTQRDELEGITAGSTRPKVIQMIESEIIETSLEKVISLRQAVGVADESTTPMKMYKTAEGKIIKSRVPLQSEEGVPLETVSHIPEGEHPSLVSGTAQLTHHVGEDGSEVYAQIPVLTEDGVQLETITPIPEMHGAAARTTNVPMVVMDSAGKHYTVTRAPESIAEMDLETMALPGTDPLQMHITPTVTVNADGQLVHVTKMLVQTPEGIRTETVQLLETEPESLQPGTTTAGVFDIATGQVVLSTLQPHGVTPGGQVVPSVVHIQDPATGQIHTQILPTDPVTGAIVDTELPPGVVLVKDPVTGQVTVSQTTPLGDGYETLQPGTTPAGIFDRETGQVVSSTLPPHAVISRGQVAPLEQVPLQSVVQIQDPITGQIHTQTIPTDPVTGAIVETELPPGVVLRKDPVTGQMIIAQTPTGRTPGGAYDSQQTVPGAISVGMMQGQVPPGSKPSKSDPGKDYKQDDPRTVSGTPADQSLSSFGSEFYLLPHQESHGYSPYHYERAVSACSNRSVMSDASALSLYELNSSWRNLNIQLSQREHELQTALQQQEKYQHDLQDVTRRLEQANKEVNGGMPKGAMPPGDLEAKLAEHQNLKMQIANIEDDIRKVKDKGADLIARSDPQGQQAMETTLQVLTDKLNALKAQSEDKEKQLKDMKDDRKKHEQVMKDYETKIKEFEDWLLAAKLDNASEPISSYDVEQLRNQLKENEGLQDDLNGKLQELHDLAVQCEELTELESPQRAAGLKAHLSELKKETTDFKLDTISKHGRLEDALRESERKNKELDEYRKSVENLQKWIEDTKKIAQDPVASAQATSKLSQEGKQLQEGIESDLNSHKALLTSISRQGSNGWKDRSSSGSDEDASEAEVNDKWRTLSRQLSERKLQLQDAIEKSRPQEFHGEPLLYYTPYPSIEPDTADKVADIRNSLAELNECWDKLQGQVDDKQKRLEQTLNFQQLYQEALGNISEWLDALEMKLFNVGPEKDTEQHLRDNEALQREIQSLQNEIGNMNRASQQVMSDASAESKNLIRQTIGDLNSRIQALEAQAKEREQELIDRNNAWKKYQDEIRTLQMKLAGARQQYSTASLSTEPIEGQLKENKKLEDELKGYERELADLTRNGEELAAHDPRMGLPVELTTLQAHWLELQQLAADRRAQLQRANSVKNQYEKVLEEYAEFLETAQNKLKTDTIAVKDLPHLQHQLEAHKAFFNDLESHRSMLDTLADQVDSNTRERYQQSHTRLNNLTHLIQDKASLRGQKLERLAAQWDDFNEQFLYLIQWLNRLEQQLPEKAVEDRDSIEELRRKIWDYHTVQSALNEEKATMYQAVDKGRQLLQSVACPGLETSVADFAEHWVQINNDTATELKRLENLVDQWEKFERDATTLETWLSSATSRMEMLGNLEDLDLQNIGAIRKKMDLFLDYRKEVENHQVLKTKVTTLGNQLLRSRPSDTVLRERLKRIEDSWLHLMCDMPNNEESLHAAQMELLPSRQALNELMLWMDSLEAMIKEDNAKPVASLMEVQILLQKYQGTKIDLSNKQLTVDFVNETALKQESDAHPSERTEFAERLGLMNIRYQSLSSDVTEKLKTLEMLQLRWEEYEKNLNQMITWFEDQDSKVKKYHRIGHEVSVQQALKDCKVLAEQLKKREDDIDNIKRLGTSLVETGHGEPKTLEDVNTTIDHLNHQWATLDHQIYQLQNTLEDMLKQWEKYNEALQKTGQKLTETEYSLARYNTASGDVHSFSIQVNQLKGLQSDFTSSKPTLERLVETSGHLVHVCEPVVGLSVQKSVDEMKTRWESLSSQLALKIEKFETILSLWQEYDTEFSKDKAWLDAKEREANELLSSENLESREETLNHCNMLRNELQNYKDQLRALSKLSGHLMTNMDNTTIVHITLKESALNQTVLSLIQALDKHIHNLDQNISKHQRFQEAARIVDGFLSDSDTELRVQDPTQSSDGPQIKARLDQLKEVMEDFKHKQHHLDSLNDIGYRLPLGDTDAGQLKELNQQWYSLYTGVTERYKAMQAHMLNKQNFNEKCEEWMLFLARVEKDLAADIAGNLEGLLEQKKAFEIFQGDMYSRRQILHAIINDGHQMLREGSIEDQEEFEKKLNLLDDQWQSVIRRANQRKAIIDNNIAQWHLYQSQKEKLEDSLKEMDHCLQTMEFKSAPIQRVKTLLETVRANQKDIAANEQLYQKVHDTGKSLMTTADTISKERIKKDLGEIQTQWFDVLGRLDTTREDLERILRQWNESEDGIDDILQWLKNIRKELIKDLPDNYDDLQKDLQQCKEFETAFENTGHKKESLVMKEKQLADKVNPADVAILNQRLCLLSKQWEEIQNQVLLRKQHLQDKVNEWETFNNRYKEICDAMDQMENTIMSNQEYHIEDLLSKLQNEYKEELAKLGLEKDDLIGQGKRLMRGSSEIRANAIEYKISKMNDKWQRLNDITFNRMKKLQETLMAVQQLEANMSNLRQWLAYIEHALSSPIAFRKCDITEIQHQLQEQQELQRDIERHSTGIGSVINLCEVLLHDVDACPTDVECSAIEQAMKSLDKRWKNICALSTERRLRIEETWRLWQTFHDEYIRFTDWLSEAERQSKTAQIETASFIIVRHEFARFETLQRQVHENLGKLEILNKQYRRLAREGRTDTNGQLKEQIHECNRRWDELSLRLSAVLRRLKHMSTVKDDFDATREALTLWLSDLDLQLNNLEHLSETDIPAQMKYLKSVQQEIDQNASRLEYIDKVAAYLMQKSEPADAVQIQRDLDDFHTLVGGILKRLTKIQNKLDRARAGQGRLGGPQEQDYDPDLTFQGYDSSLEDNVSIQSDDTNILMSSVVRFHPSVTDRPNRSRSSSPQRERAVMTSAPMDWGVYGGSQGLMGSPTLSPRDMSPPSEIEDTDMESPEEFYEREEDPERWNYVKKHVSHRKDKLARVEVYLAELEKAIHDVNRRLDSSDKVLRCSTPVGPETEHAFGGYSIHVAACKDSIDTIRGIETRLKQETGLSNLRSGDAYIGGILRRWQMLQEQAMNKDFRLDQRKHQWVQFRSDLRSLLQWLDDTERAQMGQIIPKDVKELEGVIQEHREFLVQLDHRKPIVLSINLLSKEILEQDTPESRELAVRLREMNRRFDEACNRAARWQQELQIALMQSDDFHQTIRDLLYWLESVDNKIKQVEPVKYDSDQRVLQHKYNTLKELKSELLGAEPRVISLRDTAEEMLSGTSTQEAEETREKLQVIASRLSSLLRICINYMKRLSTLSGREGTTDYDLGRDEPDYASGVPLMPYSSRRAASPFTSLLPEGAPSASAVGRQDDDAPWDNAGVVPSLPQNRRGAFLSRVFRTALPLQMLMLLLLGVACLVPMSEEDYSCLLANNFRKSFDPMLNYPDGHPPF